ncbi:MAG: FecCD family ABC transporter permease [Candidatus Bipolaricaulaceae bacterium]
MSPKLAIAAAALLCALSLPAAVTVGPVPIPVGTSWRAVVSPSSDPSMHEVIVRQLRLPRVLLGFLVGASLALAGGVMQGLFRNPLASPYLLGIAAGAAAGAAGAIALGFPGPAALPVGAFLGGSSAVLLVYRLALSRTGRSSPLGLILAGVALGAAFSALTSFLLFISAGDRRLAEILFWTMGGLGRSCWSYVWVLLPVAGVGAILVQGFARDLNALSLGEEGAFHLGVEPERLRRVLVVVATALTSTAVAFAGTVGFVGLITPHLIRLLLGPDHRVLFPASFLVGGTFLVWADAAARTACQPAELPVGVITALVGAPFFLALLRRRLP